MGGGIGRVVHHPEYYISDGSVSFLTGKILFRVHKSYFERESEIFRELFISAHEDDPESGTDKRPFTLDVSPEDFSQFLWVWYDRDYSYSSQSMDKWGTILRIAKRWRFHRIQELAIRELEALELAPAERISLYNEHDIDGKKLLQSYLSLCRSPTLPTEADGRLMKMETLIKVLQAREQAQRKAIEDGHQTPTSASLDDDALMEIVSSHFKKSLTPQSNGKPTGSGSQVSNLNGESTRPTATTATIIVQTPQVPDKPSNSNSSVPTSRAKESTEKQHADKTIPRTTENAGKVAPAGGEKGKEEKDKQEKSKQEKEGKKARGD